MGVSKAHYRETQRIQYRNTSSFHKLQKDHMTKLTETM